MASTLTLENKSDWEDLRQDGKVIGRRVKLSYSSSGAPSTVSATLPLEGVLSRIHLVFGGTKPTNTTTLLEVFHPKGSTSGTDILGGSGTVDTTNADYPIHVNLDQPLKNQIYGNATLQISGDAASGSSMTIWVEYLFI